MIELLERLQSRGVRLRLEGGQLQVQAPKGALTPELKDLLATHRQALLDLLHGRPDEALPPFTPRPELRHEPFALTDVQHAYWMGRHAQVELGGFSTHFYVELERAGLELDRLEAGLQKVIARHDMLRAVIGDDGLQRVLPQVPPYRIEALDLRGQGEAAQQAAIESLRQRLSHNRLPPDRWPLFEIRALQRPGGRLRLFISLDMLIIDASSMFMFFDEWQRACEDEAWNPPPLRISYRDCAEYERQLQDHPALRRARDYWTARLDTLPAAPELPLALQPRLLTHVEFKRRMATVPAPAWQRLKEQARRFGATPTVLLLAAFSETLRAWSKSPDFTLNLTLFNRLPVHEEVASLLGDFTTTNLLAVHARAGDSLADRLQRLQQQLAQDLEHRQYSGMRVLRDRARRLGNAPGAAMPVVFTSTLALASQDRSGAGIDYFGRYEYGVSQTPQVWLDHQMMERPDGELLLFWDAVDALFPPGLLDDMFGAYQALLARLADDESAWTGRQPQRVLPDWQYRLFDAANATQAELPSAPLHAGAAAQAALRPDAPAVIWSGGMLTHGQLNAQASRLGRWLRQSAVPGDRVAVCMEKGPEQVVALHGVLHGVCAYLPIDASLPEERRWRLLKLAQVRIVLTQAALRRRLRWPAGVRVLVLDDAELGSTGPAGQDATRPGPAPEDLAYVLFTSGSTGEPKGVMIEHRQAANTLQDINRRFAVGPSDRVLGLSAAHFDLSVYDIFGVLAAGGAVVLPDPGRATDPAHWTELVRQHGVTLWNSVPQLLQLWTEHLQASGQGCDGLRQVILSGDWIPVRLPDQLGRCCPAARVLASGGPTETAIWCTQFPVEAVPADWKSIPYGKPLSNQSMHVLDALLEPRGVWATGEIFIGGAGVGRGYLNDEEHTAQRFIVHPRTGQRLYRSGDLGRYLPDGNIEFLGREDFQVKLNGHRIELGEIEAALRAQPAVAEALVLLTAHPATGQKQLVAYVVPRQAPLDGEALRQALAAVLPAVMVPARQVQIDRLPLSPNGKVERGALPDPWAEGPAPAAVAAPRNETERRLQALWGSLLDQADVGVHDNFFALGLDSVAMIRMLGRIPAEFGLAGVSQTAMLQRLLAGPTIAQLAVAVAEWAAAGHAGADPLGTPDAAPLVPASGHGQEPFPATDLQLGYLSGEGTGIEYPVRSNYFVEFSLAAGHDSLRLEAALNRALQRQQNNLVVLRPDGQLQALHAWEPIRLLAVHDLRGRAGAAAAQALGEIREPLQRRMLPLDRWPWIEFRLCLLDGETRLLLNTVNHFVDAVTFRRLLEDTRLYYAQPEADLPTPALSFRDCVLAYRQLEASASGQASERYWRDRIPQLPMAPALPQCAGTDPTARSRLVRREVTIAAAPWAAFRRTAARLGVSASVALYGAYAQVLAAWSGSRHFLLAQMTSFRQHVPHPQAGEIAGGFGTVYPMEIDLREPLAFHQQLQRLQAQSLRDAQHQHWGGGRVWQALNQARKTAGRAAAPYVVVSGLDLPPWEQPFHGCLETPQVLFDHQFWNLADGRLWLVLDVNEQHFPPGLVDAFWQACQALVLRLGEDEAAWEQPGFDLLPPAQRAVRAAANRTAAPVPTGLLQDLLQEAAARWPDRPAVISPEKSVSWHELQAWSNRLSHRLRSAGVGRADPVVVAIERGAGQVAAVQGVLGAGGAYVPVDPAWPAERIAFVLQDTGAACVLASRATAAVLALPPQVACVCVDDASLDQHPATPLPALQQPGDLAYVIYTSGSTGRPKGVMIDHRAALNTVLDVNRRSGITERDVVYGISALSFDLSVYDLFGTAAAGATLVLPGAEQAQQPAAWVDAVRQHGVTVWNSVPALMQLLIDAAHFGSQQLPSLKTVMLSGDWIPVALPAQARDVLPCASWHSLGGATEAAIWSIHYPIGPLEEGWSSIPYGKPLANQCWHVLADDGTDAPEWVPGHLHIGGLGLALGYWRDEQKTARAFVTHPRTGERLYRTGDLGRYLPDGNLEFLGRADHQVKIQGHRIELGEVEHALQAHPGVQAAAVLAQGQRAGQRLVGFYVPVPGHAIDSAALQAHLHAKLPAYMVPLQLVQLPRLPLSANGKFDRAALLQQAGDPLVAALPRQQAPRTPLEARLARIWKSVLGLTDVGVHDDFFDLGGQSFAAMQVMTRIAQQLGRQLPLGELLRGRTIAQLAHSLQQAAGWSPLVRIHEAETHERSEPLFLVHPAGGNVLCYRALAQRLHRPVFGLQAAGLDGEREALDDLPAMAALYVQALRERQPLGPYHLGGWSSGGLVAFEMARQLEEAGEAVARLVLIDTPAPAPLAAVAEATLLRWFVEDMASGAPGAGAVAPGVHCESLAQAVALINECRRDTDPLTPAQVEPVWRVFRAMLKASQAYGGGRVRSALVVVKASEQRVDEFASHPHRHAPDWGWSGFTGGGVLPLKVPGDHYSMWQGTGLDRLVALFLRPDAPPASPAA